VGPRAILDAVVKNTYQLLTKELRKYTLLCNLKSEEFFTSQFKVRST